MGSDYCPCFGCDSPSPYIRHEAVAVVVLVDIHRHSANRRDRRHDSILDSMYTRHGCLATITCTDRTSDLLGSESRDLCDIYRAVWVLIKVNSSSPTEFTKTVS